MREDAEPKEQPRESRNIGAKLDRFLSKSNRGKKRGSDEISDADVARARDAGATILPSLVAGWIGVVRRTAVEWRFRNRGADSYGLCEEGFVDRAARERRSRPRKGLGK